MTQLKSDRMLEALEKLEAVRDEYKRDWADPDSHLHLTIEGLKDALAQQLLTERRRRGPLAPVIIKGYNDEPPERSTLGHTGHPFVHTMVESAPADNS